MIEQKLKNYSIPLQRPVREMGLVVYTWYRQGMKEDYVSVF